MQQHSWVANVFLVITRYSRKKRWRRVAYLYYLSAH